MAIVFLIGGPFIKFIEKHKITGPIREDGPIDHIIKKVGTPTMGGVLILIGILFGTLLWADLKNGYIWATLGITIAYGLIGFFDDYLNRWQDLANSHLSCQNMILLLDSMISIIDPEMPRQISTWGGGSYGDWQQNVQDLRDFINQRCTAMNDGFVPCYQPEISGPYNVTVEIIGVGEVQMSNGNFINNTNNALIFFKTCIKNGIKNIIFSSTAAVYGNPKKTLINENSSLIPLNPYGKSKLKTEKILMQLKKKYKINYMILRYFNVAGADNKMRSGLISKKSTHLIKIATEAVVGKRKSISIFGTDYNTFDGTGIRDYIHVSDLADIHLKSLEYLLKTKNSTIMNCGYGKGYSVKEVLDYMNKICNGKLKINHKNRRIGDATSLVADIKKLKKTIKWKPKYNDLNIILKTALKWEKKLRNEKIL